MSKQIQRLADYLSHVIEAIERIEEYTADVDELRFMNTHLIQDAVVRNFEVIGEASRNIQVHYPEFIEQHPELPLLSAYEMRNAVAHGYSKVDYQVVWKTIQNDLPDLYRLIKAAQK